jgi:hypothetical protein
LPRFQYVAEVPEQGPSLLGPHFAIARSCAWYSMSLLKSPCDVHAEVRARPALPRPVAQLLCNRQVLRVVLERLGKVHEGVDEVDMYVLQLLPLLHTVGFFFFFPLLVLSVPFTKPTDSTRERERERQTGSHSERGRGRKSECTRMRARSVWSTCSLCSPHHCPPKGG